MLADLGSRAQPLVGILVRAAAAAPGGAQLAAGAVTALAWPGSR